MSEQPEQPERDVLVDLVEEAQAQRDKYRLRLQWLSEQRIGDAFAVLHIRSTPERTATMTQWLDEQWLEDLQYASPVEHREEVARRLGRRS
jgi:hypothetical protein